MTYGSEAWLLDEKTCKKLNGVNAAMLSYFTGKSIREESTAEITTLDILSGAVTSSSSPNTASYTRSSATFTTTDN